MPYAQSLIWGTIKETPLLIVFFYILDTVEKKEMINQTNIIFRKFLFISVIFIFSLTINGIFGSNVLTINDIINKDYTIIFCSELINQLKDLIDWKMNAIIEIFGNIFLFIPFGFSLSYFLWYKNKRIWMVMFKGCIFSIIIEITQLIFGRIFDIKDIVLNVFGTLIGYYLFSYSNQIIIHFYEQDTDMSNKYVVKKIKLKFFEILILLLIYIRMLI